MQLRFRQFAACLQAAVWVVLLLASACGGANTVERSDARTIQSDADGSISHWLLQLADGSPPEFLHTQAALVAATPTDVAFRVAYGDVATRDAFLQELRRRGVRTKDRVEMVRTAGLHYAWLRDLFVAGVGQAGTPLVLMNHPEHLATVHGAPRHVRTLQTAQALGAGRIVSTPLRLEGGSVVSDAERAFLSRKNAVLGVQIGQYPDESAFLEAAQEAWGRPVTLLSTAGADRADHADLLLMPIGDRRAVVSDPTLALRLLHQISERESARFEREVRRIAGHASKGDGIRSLLNTDCLMTLRSETDQPRRLQAFTRVRRELEAVDYNLSAVPFLSHHNQAAGARVVLSYTNVIQDTRAGQRTVYMPTYRLPTLDEYAARTWEQCGFRVVRVDALGPALKGGAVRCLSQVIRHFTAGAPSSAGAARGRP